MEAVWRVILWWRFYGKISLEIDWDSKRPIRISIYLTDFIRSARRFRPYLKSWVHQWQWLFKKLRQGKNYHFPNIIGHINDFNRMSTVGVWALCGYVLPTSRSFAVNFWGSRLKLVLHEAIFLATCLATLKQIHCKLQETCYSQQSWVATCNGLKKNSAIENWAL